MPLDAAGVLFTLVDHPAVALETIDALVGHALACPQDKTQQAGKLKHAPLLRVPRYRGKRRGHPHLVVPRADSGVPARFPDGAARDVVRSHVLQTEFVDVDDPGILADIDDPEAYRNLSGAAV